MTFEQFDDNREEQAQFKPLDFTPFSSNDARQFEPNDFGTPTFGTKDIVSSVSNDGVMKDLDGESRDASRKDFVTQLSSRIDDSVVKQGAIQSQYPAKGTTEEFGEKAVATRGSSYLDQVRSEKKREEEFPLDDHKIAFGGVSASDNAHAASIKLSDAAYAAPRLNRSAASDDAANLVTALGETKKMGEGKSGGEAKFDGEAKSGGGEVKHALSVEKQAPGASVEKITVADSAKGSLAVPELKVAKEFVAAAEITGAREVAPGKELGSTRETHPQLIADPKPNKLFEKPLDKTGPSPADKLYKEPSVPHLSQELKQPAQGSDPAKFKALEVSVRETIQFTEAAKLKAPEVTGKELQSTQSVKVLAELHSSQPPKGHAEFPSSEGLLESMKSKQIYKSDSVSAVSEQREPIKQPQSFEPPVSKQTEHFSKAVQVGDTTGVQLGEARKPAVQISEPHKAVMNFEPSRTAELLPREATRTVRNDVASQVNNEPITRAVDNVGIKQSIVTDTKLGALKGEPIGAAAVAGKLDLNKIETAQFKMEPGREPVNMRTSDKPPVAEPQIAKLKDSQISEIRQSLESPLDRKVNQKSAGEVTAQTAQIGGELKQAAFNAGSEALRKGIGGEGGKLINSQPSESVKTPKVNDVQQISLDKSSPVAKSPMGAERADTNIRPMERNLETQKQIPSNIVERNSIAQAAKVITDGGIKGENSLAAGAAGSGVRAIQEPVSNGGSAVGKVAAADRLQSQIGRTTEADLGKMKSLGGGEKVTPAEPIKSFGEPGKGSLSREVNVAPKDLAKAAEQGKAAEQVASKENYLGPSPDAKRTEPKLNVAEVKRNGIEGNTKDSFRAVAEGGKKIGDQPQRPSVEPKTSSTTQRIAGEQVGTTEFTPKLNQPAKDVPTRQAAQPAQKGSDQRGAASTGEQANSLRQASEQAQRAAHVSTDKVASEQMQKNFVSQGKPGQFEPFGADLGKKLPQDQRLAQNQKLPQEQNLLQDQRQLQNQKSPQEQRLIQEQKFGQGQTPTQEHKPLPNQPLKASVQTASRTAIEQTQKPNVVAAQRAEQATSTAKLAGTENSIRAAADSTGARSSVNLRGSVEAAKVFGAAEQGKSTTGKAEGLKTSGTADSIKPNYAFRASDSNKANDTSNKGTPNARATEVGRPGDGYRTSDTAFKANDVSRGADRDRVVDSSRQTEPVVKSADASRGADRGRVVDSSRQTEAVVKSVDVSRRAEVGGLDVNPKSPDAKGRAIDVKTVDANRAVDVNGRSVIVNFKTTDGAARSIDVNGKSFESRGRSSDGSFRLDANGKSVVAGKALDNRVSSIINATGRRLLDGQPDGSNGGKRNQQVEPAANKAEPRSNQLEAPAKQAEAASKQQVTRASDVASRQGEAGSRQIEAASKQTEAASKRVEAASKQVDAASRTVEAASRHFEPGSRPVNSKQLDPSSRQIESSNKQIESGNRQLDTAAPVELGANRGRAFTPVKFGDVDVTAELKGTTLSAKLEVKKVGQGGDNSAKVRANADVLQGFGGRFNSDGKWISTTSVPVARGDNNRYMTGLELALVLSIAGIAKYSGGDHRGYRMEGKIWSITNRHGETLIYVDGRRNPFKVSRTFEVGQSNSKTDAASAVGKTIAKAIKPFHIGSTLRGDTANGANVKGENVGKQIKSQAFVVINAKDFGKSAKMSTLTMSGVERLGASSVTDNTAGRNNRGTTNIDAIGKIAKFNVRQAVNAADFYSQTRSRYPGGFELAMVMTAAGLTRGTALDSVLNKPLDSTSGPADRSKWLSSNNHSSTPTGRGVFDSMAFGPAPSSSEHSNRNNSPFGDRYQEFLDRIDSYTKKYAQEAVMTGSTFAPTSFIADSPDELDEETDEALDKPEEEESAPNSSGNVETVLRRPMWMIAPGETLDGLAEVHYGNANLGWLIADLNMHVVRQTYIDGKRVVELRSRQQIELPVKEDIEKFQKNRKKEQCADNLITVVVERSIDREVVEQSIGKVIGSKDSNAGLLPGTGLQSA